MRKADVQVGAIYRVKVSGTVVDVRLDATHSGGGWTGTNIKTNRLVRIKTAAKLRALVKPAS